MAQKYANNPPTYPRPMAPPAPPKPEGPPNTIVKVGLNSLGGEYTDLIKAQAVQVVQNLKTYLTGLPEEIYWRYEVPEYKSAKSLLLTVGRVAVIGQWYGEYGEHFIAYSPMPKRDKQREKELGLRETPDEHSS